MFGQGGQGTNAALAQLGWTEALPQRELGQTFQFAPTGSMGMTPFSSGIASGRIGQPRFALSGFDPGELDYNRSMAQQSQANYEARMAAAQAQYGGGTGTATGSGSMASLGGDWANIDKLNDQIARAAAEAGVDPNQIKAIMKLESDGVWQTSPAGAIGYMQVMPFWGNDLGLNLNDPYQNILAGAKVLRSYLDQNNGNFYEALRGYHGYGYDGYTSDTQYADVVMGNYKALQSVGGYNGAPGVPGQSSAVGNISTIWGGQGNFPITQEIGLTDFAKSSGGYYDFARAYHGFEGHPGLDIGTPYGTKLYTPVGGTVVFGGDSGYYRNNDVSAPGVGEFRIRLDNGDELILGHMSQINLRPGQRVNAGTLVGLSGSENGDHVHVEYRKADGQGGFYIVDPRQVLAGGAVALTGGSGYANTGTGYAAPTSFVDFWRNQYGR